MSERCREMLFRPQAANLQCVLEKGHAGEHRFPMERCPHCLEPPVRTIQWDEESAITGRADR